MLNVRLPSDLYAELRVTAEQQGVSLNQLAVALLAGSIGWRPGGHMSTTNSRSTSGPQET